MNLLTPAQLHGYQQKAVNHQCTHPWSMLWLDMGLGKTAVTLTSIAHLINQGFLRSVIIVAPVRVCRLVWRQEALKWTHTQHLTFSMLTGTRDQRTRALLRPANIYLINHENLKWLSETLSTYFIKKGQPIPFNGLVWDEVSKMKNSTTDRVKAVKGILPHFDWRTGLTGTPASNGYKDLHGQFLVVDAGERLGTSKNAFKQRFYKKEGQYKEVAYADTEETIKHLIGDITLEMSAEDYNKLPDMIVNNVELELPDDLRAKYDLMEKELFVKLDSGTEVEMFNQAALTNKCLQFSNGAMYPIAGMPLWEPIHDLKLEALEDIIDESQGQPILCAYAYRSDAERIMTKFKHLRPINLTDCKSESSLNNAMTRWKSGDCALMIGHPACLHPRTQVLTELHGWISLIDVKKTDRVFDGVEFVSHDGCSYSGYKSVTNVFGITMTHDHKLLIDGEWVEVRDVGNTENIKRKALYEYQGDDPRIGEMCSVRQKIKNTQTKRGQAQSKKSKILPTLCRRVLSPFNQHSNLGDLARNAMEGQKSIRQELWRSWDNCVRRMEQFRKILRGHAQRLLGRFDHRTGRCEQAVLQGQLYMGYQHGPAGQQAQQSSSNVSRGTDTFSRTVSPVWVQQNDDSHETESRDDGRRSSGGRQEIPLRQREKGTKESHVYDLVNCGPRHRFLIRNDAGEIFISHNSMGHGIDGLQRNGHILVWYGLNWSLDLVDQFNARIRRQGQGVPVICHRILVRDTLDKVQEMRLIEKDETQAGLRKAVKNYRQMRGM